ncbi:MAG: arginyltransferase [Phycisphaerae bacterium]
MPSRQRVELVQLIEGLLEEQALPVTPEQTCPYLPDRVARHQGFCADRLDAESYVALMDRGFRRSGRVFYRPACASCQACQALRVPVSAFVPSRSQRRVWRANADLRVEVQTPAPTQEKWRLFQAYLNGVHDGAMSDAWDAMVEFLYESPVHTVEFCYFLGDDLAAVSIADRSQETLSSVYTFYDPRHARRGLGTYSALWEIDYCRQESIPFYYFGYYVANCAKMAYKARFGPCEVLEQNRRWKPLPSSASFELRGSS